MYNLIKTETNLYVCHLIILTGSDTTLHQAYKITVVCKFHSL
jgi:hypothetical protein